MLSITPPQLNHSAQRSSAFDGLVLTFGVVVCLPLVAAYATALARNAGVTQTDFGLFLYGLRSQQTGGSFYDLTVASQWGYPFDRDLLDLAPPHLHLLVWPLVSLPDRVAYGVWITANAGAFIASLAVISRELGIRWRDVTVVWFVNAVLLSTLATVSTLVYGQYVWLLMLPATLGWRAWRRDRLVAACAWLGVVASSKPYPWLLLIYPVWRGHWRAVAAMAGVSAGLGAAGAVVFGPGTYVDWVRAVGAVDELSMFGNVSIWGLVTRVTGPSHVFQPLPLPSAGVRLAGWLACVGVGAWSVWQLRRATPDRAWLGLWCAAWLVSPLAWMYYIWWALPAALALGRHEHWLAGPGPYLAVLALAVLPLWPNLWGLPWLATLVTGNLGALVVACLWWRAFRPSAAPGA